MSASSPSNAIRQFSAGSPPVQLTFRVINFKSIAFGELRASQLTILAGANSSGKSSLMQALLFVAQSLESGDIVLNGDLVKLGAPRDAVRDGTESMRLEFAWPIVAPDERGEERLASVYKLALTLGLTRNRLGVEQLALFQDDQVVIEANRPLPQAKGASAPPVFEGSESALRVSNPSEHELPQNSFIVMQGLRPSRLVYPAERERFEPEFADVLSAAISGNRAAALELARLDPGESARSSRSTQTARHSAFEKVRRIWSVSSQGQQGEIDISFTQSELRHLLRQYMAVRAPGGWVSDSLGGSYIGRRAFFPGRGQRPSEVFEWLGRTVDRVSMFANGVRYLGPLREHPQAVYPLGHTVPALPVGDKGEFSAGFLTQTSATEVTFVDPERRRRFDRLDAAVTDWCTYLTIGDTVSAADMGKLGFGLKVRINGVDRDLTDIGVGASQLLPVVIFVLGAASGAVLLLEQPELHLHPAVQSRLADFFAVARPDVSLVLETHSEYIVTRLRLRIAQEELEPDRVNVLFAEQVQGETRFKQLSFNDRGDFDYWPPGFFDSLGDDTVALAQALHRRFGRTPDAD